MGTILFNIKVIVSIFTEIELHRGIFSELNYISNTDAYKKSGLFDGDDFYEDFSRDLAFAYSPLLLKPPFRKLLPERSKRIEKFLPHFRKVKKLTRKSRSWITPGQVERFPPRSIARKIRNAVDRDFSNHESLSISASNSDSASEISFLHKSDKLFHLYFDIDDNSGVFGLRIANKHIDFEILELFNSINARYYIAPPGKVELKDDLMCIFAFLKSFSQENVSRIGEVS